MLLSVVAPSEVKNHWGNIRPVLDRLYRMGSDGWIPEDVYAFLIGGHATLYVNDGEWRGFLIMQLLPNYAGKRLHIWIAYGFGDMEPYMDEVKSIAKQAGADRITFESARKGWGRRAEHFGFRPARTIYEMEVR